LLTRVSRVDVLNYREEVVITGKRNGYDSSRSIKGFAYSDMDLSKGVNNMKRLVLLAIIVLMVSVSLVGGGQNEPAGSSGPIELKFWTLLGGRNGDLIQSQIDNFNASQNEVRIINERQGGYDDLQRKLLASVAAGNPPHLTMVDYKYVPFYAKNGVFVAINDYISKEDLQDIIPGLLTDLTYNGNIYAIPYNRSTQGVFYNGDLMRKAGFNPETDMPKTWQDMVKMGPAVKKLGDKYYVAYGKEANAQWMFEPLVYQFGGRVSDDDARFIFNLPGEGGVESMRLLQDNVHKTKYFLNGANAVGEFWEVALEWKQGEVIFTRSSTALLGSIASTVDFDWGFTAFPQSEGGSPAVTSGGANIAMTSNTTEAERKAAWKFMQFMSNTENSAWYHMQTGYMPVRYSVLNLPEIQEFHKTHPNWRISIDQLNYVKPTSRGVLNAPEWQAVIQGAVDRIMFRNEDPQKVLDEAAAELNRTIDSIPKEERIK